ncbi:MAG TPA: hypothetical protein VIR78_09380 [Malonomonas sp.]
MIWLSTLAGTQECSIYFEIRDIEVRRTGSGAQGVVRGLLGDGRRELWSEVFLGETPEVQILPEWSDAGEVEGFDAALDEALLKQQLLVSVQKIFSRIGRMASFEPPYAVHSEQQTETDYGCLVA